jgi:hypothetical protein
VSAEAGGGRPLGVRPRFVVTAAGATAGATALFVVGTSLGRAFAESRGMFELDVLGPMVVGAFAGLWVGSVLGAWLALRIVDDGRRGRTALALALADPPVVAGVYALVVNLVSDVEPYALAIGVVAAAVVARAVALIGADTSG